MGQTDEVLNHIALMFVKLSDDLDYQDLDSRVVEIATKEFGQLEKNPKTTPRNLLIFQIVGEGCSPEEFAYTRDNGHLFKSSYLARILDVTSGDPKEIPREFPGVHTKVTIQAGYLNKNRRGRYFLTPIGKRSAGYGFYLDAWNNHQREIGKREVESFRDRVSDLIDRKYVDKAKVIYKESW